MLPEHGFGKLSVTKNFSEQPAPNVFACVDWNDRGATVRMLQVMVTAPDADDFKTEALQSGNKLAARNAASRLIALR